MSYSLREISVDDAAPIEFYLFEGPSRNYLYHDSDEQDELIFNGLLYRSLSISRSKILIGSKSLVQTNDITVPFDCDLAVDHAYLESPEFLSVIIERAHAGELSDSRRIWAGRAQNFTLDGISLRIETQQSSTGKSQNNLLGTFVQTSCNHTLFDDYCKVIRADHTTFSHVVTTGPASITVDDDGVENNLLIAGEIINMRTGEKRMAVQNTDNVITLNLDFLDIEVGDQVSMSKGCTLTARVCQTIFGNGRNFGGFSYVPRELPKA